MAWYKKFEEEIYTKLDVLLSRVIIEPKYSMGVTRLVIVSVPDNNINQVIDLYYGRFVGKILYQNYY